jgi:hypothetical protein
VTTQLRARAELAALIRALGPTTVRWVVLKGPILADIVYRRPAVRTYTDLDVLVHPHDLGEALDALEGAGFELVDRNWELVARSGRGEINLTIPNGGLLDLHWHVVNDGRARSQFSVDVRSMVSRRVTVDIDGLSVPTLDPVDTIVHLALHASLSGGHRALWLLDLQQAVLHGGCTVEELRERAQEMRTDLVVQVMLARAARYVDQRLEEWASDIRTRVSWTRLCEMVSGSAPPLGVRPGKHTGRLVFSATRATTGGSAAAVIRSAGQRGILMLRKPVTRETLHASDGTPADRALWIAGARLSE